MRKITRFFRITCRLILALFFVLAFIQPCFAWKAPHVPTLLQPWVDWVLHDKEEQLACIPQYNDPNIYQCNWPSELDVALNDKGGDFSQTRLVHHESWVALPGNSRQWPQDVQVDGESQIMVQRNKAPKIQLQPGYYMITGRFTWPNLPEYLQIPAGSALVSLTLNNQKMAFPNIDGSGRLWLKRILADEKIENRLKIESFRLIDDSIPSQVLLYFTLDVAGSAREIRLGPLYDPEKFTPLHHSGVAGRYLSAVGEAMDFDDRKCLATAGIPSGIITNGHGTGGTIRRDEVRVYGRAWPDLKEK